MRLSAVVLFVPLALLVAPLAAEAQPAGKVYRLGLLDVSAPDPGRVAWWRTLREELGKLGYVEGQTIAFEPRWANGKIEALPGLAAELVRLRVDAIVTGGGDAAVAAQQATTTVPIVMATGADPVERGLVASLGRPGGNVTGVTSIGSELSGKRLQLLREVVPKVSRFGVLFPEGSANAALVVRDAEVAARTLGVRLQVFGVRDPGELDRAFGAMTRERVGALLVAASPVYFSERRRIAELALKHRLPTATGSREYVDAGGLMSYAPSYPDLFRGAARYVDKILKGAKPADLPVEQPTRFEFVINQRTARALGLTFPQSILLRVTEAIE